MKHEFVADDEKTIEICSREILRLEARERDLEAENEGLRVMLYGSTGWEENEINERLALLKE